MRVFNATGQRLTGADKRSLARDWRRLQRKHLKRMIRYKGEEEGSELSKRIRQAQEKMLIQVEPDGVHLVTNAIYKGYWGVYTCRYAWRRKEDGTWVESLPVVKI